MNTESLQRLLAAAPSYSAADILAMRPYVTALLSALDVRMLDLQRQSMLPEADRLLTPHEAAERLGMSVTWLRRHAWELPFAIKIGNDLRCSVRGLDQWIAMQEAAKMETASSPPPHTEDHP